MPKVKNQDGLMLKGHLKAILETVRDERGRFLPKAKRTKEIYDWDNLVVTAGKAAIANFLSHASPTPTSIRVNYVALGSGTNSPAAGDTTLQTEVFRKATASADNTSNVATITGFFTQTETTGTYREAGLFMSGTASANTGTLLSRVAINITKTGSQTLTIEWTITIS